MSALFNKNIDGSYSLHITQYEFEALVVLLASTKLGQQGHPQAVTNMIIAIEDVVGDGDIDDICAAVPINVEHDEYGDLSIQVG